MEPRNSPMNTTKTFDTSRTSEATAYNRRQFLRNAAVMTGAAQLGLTGLVEAQSGTETTKVTAGTSDSIRPFRVNIPDADLADLKRRILATKWPERENVPDASQGVQLATIKALTEYWATEYDWRKV